MAQIIKVSGHIHAINGDIQMHDFRVLGHLNSMLPDNKLFTQFFVKLIQFYLQIHHQVAYDYKKMYALKEKSKLQRRKCRIYRFCME
jgi:hypothetical protein